jgi:hypothetical protein
LDLTGILPCCSLICDPANVCPERIADNDTDAFTDAVVDAIRLSDPVCKSESDADIYSNWFVNRQFNTD